MQVVSNILGQKYQKNIRF